MALNTTGNVCWEASEGFKRHNMVKKIILWLFWQILRLRYEKWIKMNNILTFRQQDFSGQGNSAALHYFIWMLFHLIFYLHQKIAVSMIRILHLIVQLCKGLLANPTGWSETELWFGCTFHTSCKKPSRQVKKKAPCDWLTVHILSKTTARQLSVAKKKAVRGDEVGELTLSPLERNWEQCKKNTQSQEKTTVSIKTHS